MSTGMSVSASIKPPIRPVRTKEEARKLLADEIAKVVYYDSLASSENSRNRITWKERDAAVSPIYDRIRILRNELK